MILARWLDFVRSLPADDPMPIARAVSLRVLRVEAGAVTAGALPGGEHFNPLGVVQGGFAATVLDIVLGLVSITVLPDRATGVATAELSVRYVRAISDSTGPVTISGRVLHHGSSTIIAQAEVTDDGARVLAMAQSTSLVLYSR